MGGFAFSLLDNGLLAAAVALLSAAVAVLYRFYSKANVELVRLSEAAGSMARGDYGARLAAGPDDRMGGLSAAFNQMAAEMEKRDRALKENAMRLSRAEQLARMGSWEWDIVNDRFYWSDDMYRMLGQAPQEDAGNYESVLAMVVPEDRELVKRSLYSAFYHKKPFSIDHRVMRADGAERIMHSEGDVFHDCSGVPVRMTGFVQDITEARRAEFELKKLSMAIEGSVNVVFITDAHGNIEYVNPMFEQVTGYTREEAIGQNPRILSSGELTNEQYEDLWKGILSGRTWRSVYKNRKKKGGFYWCNSVITPIRNENGKITHFLAVQEDVTEKMHSEERARYLESHDELTGLINRARFMAFLDEWIRGDGAGKGGALLLSDMDQFKFLNDAYGYGTGDDILRRIGSIIAESVAAAYGLYFPHAKPVVGRIGGDEFAVFLPFAREKEGLALAESLRTAVEGFQYDGDVTSSTISTGIVLYPEHGQNTKDLFSNVDAAMYRAKELGRNRSHILRAEDRDLEKLHSRLSWKEKILKALREDRFRPYFQPILRLADGRILHYEVLARMVDDDGGLLLPGAFIEVAERFGLVSAIDRTIIEKAMRLLAELDGKSRLSFSMNLSGREIGDEELLVFIKSKMNETGVSPGSLIFEITETAAIGDLERAKKFTRSLKGLGCRLSLDDFGVGFTSFVYLKELNVDYIKIDGSFIKKLHQSPADQVVVKAMTDCAKGLNISTVAEFVENQKTLDLLKKLGVDYAQGYLIGRPSPSPEGEVG